MNILDLEGEKFKSVTVFGYTFKIRFITQKDRLMIGNRRADIQGNRNIDAMTVDEFSRAENIATVDICTESMPKEFNQNESCVNWPDDDLVTELAEEIRKHSTDIKERLKKNRPLERGEKG